MKITVTRYRKTSETIDGRLTIDGSLRLCDTAENARHAIPAGLYHVSIIKCDFHSRKMPCIMLSDNYQPSCKDCCKSDCSGFNSTPHKGGDGGGLLYCPMLKPGNGVYNRTDGAIILGTYITAGCLKHPKEAFDLVYDRIRKSAERGHELLLEIVEAYPVEKKVPHTLYEKCEDWLQRIENTPQLLPAPIV